MKFKTFLEMVNKSDIPAYLRKNDKMTTKDLEKERTKNRSHPETIKKINGTVQEEVELDESVFDSKDDAQSIANKLKTKHDDGNYSVVADHGKHRVVHSYHSDSRVKKDIAKLNEEQIDEANHREFASQGKMHPDMAKHMKTGEHMDYYEPKTGDKVHGKVMKNDGKEVHVKQTHDSYDPKKVGSVHKFTVSTKLDEAKKEDPPFDGPYTKTPATTKDKSGAVHTAMSRAKHLAKQAMKNVKEEVEELEEQAPVLDKKYIKGTPEHKAYKATKKPINGMPTNKESYDDNRRGFGKRPREDDEYHVPDPKVKKEELKGNQHKIDKNKNGKIDSHDFKLLRKEEEQLDELSKGTLGSYIKKASNDLANKGAALGKKQADADEVDRYTNRHMPNQSDERERMRKAVGASHDDINKVRSGAIKRNKNIGKAVDRLSKEEFENGELETMSKSYKQFVESLNEIKMSDLPSRKISGSSYGAQYHDAEGDDEEEKPKAKPAADAVKRGRGRPAGAKSGARQGGSAPKTKNGADYTGYKLHLPNKN